jgi:hypothetical protein
MSKPFDDLEVSRPDLPADVDAFVTTVEQYVSKGDGGADEKDSLELCGIIRKQAAELAEARANEQAAIREIGSVVASVAKELDLRFCDPHGNEDVSAPVRRMRARLAKLELAIDAALSGLYGLSFTPSEFDERAKLLLDALKRARDP